MKEPTERCPKCGVDYPPEILQPLVTSEGNTKAICAICALETTNRAHGLHRKKFDGPQAEALRQAAIAWRKKIGVVD